MTGVTVKFTLPHRIVAASRKGSTVDAIAAESRSGSDAAAPMGQTNDRYRPARLMRRAASTLARRLALAHYIERLVDAGDLRDCADAARRLGMSRASITQVTDLLFLSTAAQESLLGSRSS